MAVGAAALSGAASCIADRYAGVDLRADGAPIEVQALARKARGGDKRAQLSLGRRYELGDGVPRDWERAARLYFDAAADESGTQWVYSPPSSGRAVGSMIGVRGSAASRGLPEARERLARLANRAEP